MRGFKLSVMSIMALAVSSVAALMPAAAHGQIFVPNRDSGTIGEYTTSGATVNASLVSGLNDPIAIAVTSSGVGPSVVPLPPAACSTLGTLGLLGLVAAVRARKKLA